jgi:hypothetical protein
MVLSWDDGRPRGVSTVSAWGRSVGAQLVCEPPVAAQPRKNLDALRDGLVAVFGERYVTGINFAVAFGSRLASSDMDLMIVGPFGERERATIVGDLDLVELSWREFQRRRRLLDLSVVDVALSGELVIGNEEIWSELVREIKAAGPTPAAIAHAQEMSLETLCSAQYFFDRDQTTTSPEDLRRCVCNLGFSLSNAAYAARLRLPNGDACSLADLKEGSAFPLDVFWHLVRRAKGFGEVSGAEVNSWLTAWKGWLLGGGAAEFAALLAVSRMPVSDGA